MITNIGTGTGTEAKQAKQATNQFQHKVNWFSTYIQKSMFEQPNRKKKATNHLC